MNESQNRSHGRAAKNFPAVPTVGPCAPGSIVFCGIEFAIAVFSTLSHA